MPMTDGRIPKNLMQLVIFVHDYASRHFLQSSLRIECIFFISGQRSNNFIIGLTDVSPATTAPTLWNYDVCAQYPGVVGAGATVYLPCTSCMPPRRYLIVQVELVNDVLNLCEIEVFVRRKSICVVLQTEL